MQCTWLSYRLLTYMWTYIASECKWFTENLSKIFFFLLAKILTVLWVDNEHPMALETECFSVMVFTLVLLYNTEHSSQNRLLNELIK